MKARYKVAASITIYLDANIITQDMETAAKKFERYIKSGNYDREIMRSLTNMTERNIDILYVHPIWEKEEALA